MVSLKGFRSLYTRIITFNLEHFVYMLLRSYPCLTKAFIFPSSIVTLAEIFGN